MTSCFPPRDYAWFAAERDRAPDPVRGGPPLSMVRPPPRDCFWTHEGPCRKRTVVRIFWRDAVAISADYCAEHAAEVRRRSQKPGAIIHIEYEESLDG